MSEIPAVPDPEQLALYCPTCAYDVRFTTEDRCPECGVRFERAELGGSRIPWVHRERLGHVKAFLRTIAFGTGSSKKLAQEAESDVAWRDATLFRWTVVTVLALFATVLVSSIYPMIDLKQFHVDYNEWVDIGITSSEPPMSPLLYPFFAPWTGPGLIAVIGISTFMSSLAVSWWLRTCFWMFGGRERKRASTISLYVFAWWIPVCISINGILCIGDCAGSHDPPIALMVLACVLELGIVVSVGLWMIRVLLLLRKMTNCGGGKLTLAACVMPAGVVLAVVSCVVAVDYLLGMSILVISGFQR